MDNYVITVARGFGSGGKSNIGCTRKEAWNSML